MHSIRKILIGVTGGIAAYKVPLLVRLLRKDGCEVKTVLTTAARMLVGEEALQTLSGNTVYTDGESRHDMEHIRLSEWADVFAICPATANTIAKIACGIADNLLTSLALSIPEEKIIVVPAMNSVMWANRATQSNIVTLGDRGITVLPVEDGELACGVSGPGRMLEIDEIVRRILAHDNRLGGNVSGGGNGDAASDDRAVRRILNGKKILISSGPTEEPIDPVRVITNRSSGKMGAALANTALSYGARVTVVTGPASTPLPAGAKVVPVGTAAEMEREMVERFADTHICIMAAAVSDYRAVNLSNTKLRRAESGNITLELTPNPDILAKLGMMKSGQFLAGFSLESEEDGVKRAEAKMNRKNCDMIVYNSADTAIGGDNTCFTILSAAGTKQDFPVMDKSEAARIILINIARVMP